MWPLASPHGDPRISIETPGGDYMGLGQSPSFVGRDMQGPGVGQSGDVEGHVHMGVWEGGCQALVPGSQLGVRAGMGWGRGHIQQSWLGWHGLQLPPQHFHPCLPVPLWPTCTDY